MLLTTDLWKRFSSSEGYMLYPDVLPVFQDLRALKDSVRSGSIATQISVGIVTNSDGRVPSVLLSLGLKVGSLRYGMDPAGMDPASSGVELSDIDFVISSYDVGYEKPSRKIFDAAKDLGRLGDSQNEHERYVHVGDDLGEDLEAAVQAGWKGLLLERESRFAPWRPGTTANCISSLQDLIYRIRPEWEV